MIFMVNWRRVGFWFGLTGEKRVERRVFSGYRLESVVRKGFEALKKENEEGFKDEFS